MHDHVPSPTALKVAALRALHQAIDAPLIFRDPLAARILGPGAAEIVASYRPSAADSRRLRATLAVRAAFGEAAIVAAAAHGIRQCVILGAGLDTFAYRTADPALRVYEVDHPATQAWKRELLRVAAIEVPASARHVAVDFERDDLLTALAGAGLDPNEPAIFAMLGVIFYLRRESVVALLRRLAEACAKGTEIVLDYTEPLHRAEPEARAAYEAAALRVAAGGEPWVSFFEPAELHATLRGAGFTVVEDADAPVLNTRCCADRADGLAVASLMHMLRARI